MHYWWGNKIYNNCPYKSEEVGEALINSVFSKYCVPDYIIMDLDSAFMSSLMNYLFKRLGIKIKTVAQ